MKRLVGVGGRDSMYLKQLVMANVRGYRTGHRSITLDFERPDGTYAGWTVLAGRNGAGKSTFLRAVALVLAGPSVVRSLMPGMDGWISTGESYAKVHAAFSIGDRDRLSSSGALPLKQPWAGLRWSRDPAGLQPVMKEDLPKGAPLSTPKRGLWSENPVGWFVAGYGPFRRLSGAAAEAQRLMLGTKRTAALVSLFDESASLAESTWWLQELYPKVLEGDPTARSLQNSVIKLLNDGLLPTGVKVSRYDSAGLWIEQDGNELVLTEMSDGYRVVAALVLDIVRRIHAAYGEFYLDSDDDGNVSAPYDGVVLIDEVDVHLHVSWQQDIGFWLRSHFPRVQFIVSTHSPYICQAASPRGLIRLPSPGEPDRTPAFLDEPTFNSVVNGDADRAVMSDLFGLESPFSDLTLEKRRRLRDLEADPEAGERIPEIEELRSELVLGPSEEVAEALRLLVSLDD